MLRWSENNLFFILNSIATESTDCLIVCMIRLSFNSETLMIEIWWAVPSRNSARWEYLENEKEKQAIIRLISLLVGRSPVDEGVDDAPTQLMYISLNDVRLLFYSNLSSIKFHFVSFHSVSIWWYYSIANISSQWMSCQTQFSRFCRRKLN